METAERLEKELTARGFQVLLDDRDQRAGVKFKDADLLGLPWRVTVGEKKLAVGQVEIKRRGAADASDVAIETAAAWLADRRGRKSPEAVPA